MEHRYRQRQRIFAIVEVKIIETPSRTGMIYNFSLDGAFILCTAPPKVGKFVNIRLLATHENDLFLPVSGIIIHRNENGFGLMFIEQGHQLPNTLEFFRNRCLITTYN